MQTARNNDKWNAENGPDHSVEIKKNKRRGIDQSEKEKIRFYYNREERLKRLRSTEARKKFRFLANRRVRSLLIIFVDLILISVLVYLLNRPTNLYVQHTNNGEIYELNITDIRGRKTLIGFTLKNNMQVDITFSEDSPVVLKITDRSENAFTFEKFIQKDTILAPEEATSVMFLLDQNKLPGAGRLDVFYGDTVDPIFSQKVRF
jgi:hypothetical protein